jgi:hypothetical protein
MSNAVDSIKRNTAGQFLKGSGGLGGRKRGSRNKISELVLKLNNAAASKHGADIMENLCQKAKTDAYLGLKLLQYWRTFLSNDTLVKMLSIDVKAGPEQFSQAYALALKLTQGESIEYEDNGSDDDQDYATEGY